MIYVSGVINFINLFLYDDIDAHGVNIGYSGSFYHRDTCYVDPFTIKLPAHVSYGHKSRDILMLRVLNILSRHGYISCLYRMTALCNLLAVTLT